MEHVIDRAARVLGSQRALAAVVGVTKAAVWQWKGKGRSVPVEHCVAIERATNGAVTRRDLRPDDWHLIWPELADPKHRTTAEVLSVLHPVAAQRMREGLATQPKAGEACHG